MTIRPKARCAHRPVCSLTAVRRTLGIALLWFAILCSSAHARLDTVDSLSAPAGNEGPVAVFARWLYGHFGPVGFVLTILMALILFLTLRRSSSPPDAGSEKKNGQP